MSKILLASFIEVGLSIGIAEQTSRNWVSAGKFPIPTFLIGRKRMVRVADVEAFVDGLGKKPTDLEGTDSVPLCYAQKSKRGRPRKLESQENQVGKNGQGVRS
jgi:hypothetical protein